MELYVDVSTFYEVETSFDKGISIAYLYIYKSVHHVWWKRGRGRERRCSQMDMLECLGGHRL